MVLCIESGEFVPFALYHTMFSCSWKPTVHISNQVGAWEQFHALIFISYMGASMCHWVGFSGRSVWNSVLMLKVRGSVKQGVI